jgi:large subunit ribosomal protein L13e
MQATELHLYYVTQYLFFL